MLVVSANDKNTMQLVPPKRWRRIFKTKLLKRCGVDSVFYFSNSKFRKIKKIPRFGYVYLFKRIFALPQNKRRLFFFVFRGFGRFRPRYLFYRRLYRRARKTRYSRVVSSLSALKHFYGFRRLKTIKMFLRLSRSKKSKIRDYVFFFSKQFSKVRKLFKRVAKQNKDHGFVIHDNPSSTGVKQVTSSNDYEKKTLDFKSVKSRNKFLRYVTLCQRVHFLEFRLFTVLLRSGFYRTASSLFRAIRSGTRIFVNSKVVSSPHFLLFEGDVITFSKLEGIKIKLFLARILRGVFFKKRKTQSGFRERFESKVPQTTSTSFTGVQGRRFRSYYHNAAKFKREGDLRRKYFFFERCYQARYCRRFPIFCLPFSSRHFLVSYSIPAILICSNILKSSSLSYPFSKQIVKPALNFYSR